MTGRERLLAVLNLKIPDHVPASPDTSNMIPARMTGKKFWDLYLYQDPPLWYAYIDCIKYFDADALMNAYPPVYFPELDPWAFENNEYIIYKDDSRIITRRAREANGKLFWATGVTVYYDYNPPSHGVHYSKLGLPETPLSYEKVTTRNNWPTGEKLLALAKERMGEHGLVGVTCGKSLFINSEEEIYAYYDDPGRFVEARDRQLDYFVKRFHRLMAMDTKPDFIHTGASGTLVFQTVDTFRKLGLPVVKEITRLCREHGIPTHLHSCGPEAELVKICAEETDLTSIDPLEISPMGDCNLKELKKRYGGKLVLKGNLHTTDVMLHGTPESVRRAARRAIDDAGEGGGFILSTGDQCGRDTPDENIFAMIETARTYGRYPLK